MGTDIHVIVVGGPYPLDLATMARRRIDQLEQMWSRFIPNSEISRLNDSAGTPMTVSRETLDLVVKAKQAWVFSGGGFDPTVLGAMIRAGYDRPFDELGPNPRSGHSRLGVGADDIVVDADRRVVCLPPGTGFDPGGIGKGLAADLVAAQVIAAGADGVCVNLGGDVRVTGAAPDGGGWTVAVEHPWSPEPIAQIGVADGAVATSTTLRRQWQVGGERRHHLIDPQTGLPSTTDLTLATVVAGDAWIAEVLAKAVILRGSAHPFDIVTASGAEALAVDSGGVVQTTSGFARYLGEACPS